jgi:uncharacterized protein
MSLLDISQAHTLNTTADGPAAHHGDTALRGTIFKGELAVARKLLNAKCNPNQQNAAGQTAAMCAAPFGHIETLQSLKGQGADPKAEDIVGNTAESLSHDIVAQYGRN